MSVFLDRWARASDANADPCAEDAQRRSAAALLERGAVIAAIDEEPELPGTMPDEMARAIADAMRGGDTDFFLAAMRLAVRMTKEGIRERILAL